MKKYLFNPYRGIYYEDGINRTGIKVLVVGDSHYCKGGCNESDRDLCLKNPFEKKYVVLMIVFYVIIIWIIFTTI